MTDEEWAAKLGTTVEALQRARREIHEQHVRQADGLERIIPLLQQYIRTLRGEEIDYTGIGLWRIFCDQFEQAMACKVITQDQWDALRKAAGEADLRHGRLNAR